MVVESGQNNSHTEEDNEFVSWFEDDAKQSESGRLTKGKIITINENDGFVFVDVGEKNEGRIRIEEIIGADGKLLFEKGDELDVVVINENGERPIVSHKKALKRQKIQKKSKRLEAIIKMSLSKQKSRMETKVATRLKTQMGLNILCPAKSQRLKRAVRTPTSALKRVLSMSNPMNIRLLFRASGFSILTPKTNKKKHNDCLMQPSLCAELSKM